MNSRQGEPWISRRRISMSDWTKSLIPDRRSTKKKQLQVENRAWNYGLFSFFFFAVTARHRGLNSLGIFFCVCRCFFFFATYLTLVDMIEFIGGYFLFDGIWPVVVWIFFNRFFKFSLIVGRFCFRFFTRFSIIDNLSFHFTGFSGFFFSGGGVDLMRIEIWTSFNGAELGCTPPFSTRVSTGLTQFMGAKSRVKSPRFSL